MQRWWSYLFGAVIVLEALLFIVAPFFGWWLPKNVWSVGGRSDGLFYLILAITGFFFILTEALLIVFMHNYAGGPGGHEHPMGHHYSEKKVFWTSFFKRIARPVTAVIHNQLRLELFWTLLPGAILLYIAFAQVSTWADQKYQSRMPRPDEHPQIMEVNARQFEWRVRYPSPARMRALALAEGQLGYEPSEAFARDQHVDDVHVVNEVHVWRDHKVKVFLTTRDVIHSFYFPNLRLKQDALPGKVIPVWFDCTDFNTKRDANGGWRDGYNGRSGRFDDPAQVWDLACAELCGWGHYKMQGRLYVHENEADFLDWLRSAQKEELRTTASGPENAR